MGEGGNSCMFQRYIEAAINLVSDGVVEDCALFPTTPDIFHRFVSAEHF